VIGDPPGAYRVVLRLTGRPRGGLVAVFSPGVHALERFGARLAAGGRRGEEHAQVGLRAGDRGADRADDFRCPPVHAGRALRSGGGQYQPADDGRADQRGLLRDKTADGKAQEIHLAVAHGGDECDGVASHRLDGVRGGTGGAAHPGVVERHDPPARRQRVDQRRVPIVQVPAEVLKQDQRHPTLARACITVGIVDAVGSADVFVGKLRIPLGHGWSPVSLGVLGSEPGRTAAGLRQGHALVITLAASQGRAGRRQPARLTLGTTSQSDCAPGGLDRRCAVGMMAGMRRPTRQPPGGASHVPYRRRH
jgi:hypothetical protein